MPPCLASMRRCCQSLALLLLALLAMSPAAADPAGRVGRIAWLVGSAYLHQAESGESSVAMLNWPLTSGDVLSTGSGGRVEVQIGSTLLQLASATVLEFVQVDDQRVALRLLDGSVIARLVAPEAAREFELATREGRFEVREPGRYRFDVDRSGVIAGAYRGGMRFRAADIAVFIGAGQSARIWNDGRTRHEILAPVNDEFATWSAGRDRQSGSAGQLRYVSAEMTGAADLDAYGDWQETPAYGAVWFPRGVAADWAPYRAGRWAWVEPWGWTWVGDEVWGFAPFHYGRWAYLGGAWGWVPGIRAARPVYAPALVAWVGGSRVGASTQIGARPAVGWFPLAPREVYIPSYPSSARHLREVNSAQVTNHSYLSEVSSNPEAVAARTRYANQRLPQALTAVPEEAMRQRGSVREAAIRPAEHGPWSSQPAQVRAPLEGGGHGEDRRRAGRPLPQEERPQRPAGGLPPEGQADRRSDARQASPPASAAPPALAVPPLPPGAAMRPPSMSAPPPGNLRGSSPPPAPALPSQLPAAIPAPVRAPASVSIAAPLPAAAAISPSPRPLPPPVSSVPAATRDALPQPPLVPPRPDSAPGGARQPDARTPPTMPGSPTVPVASPLLPADRRDAAGRPPPAAFDERDRRATPAAPPAGSAPATSTPMTERRPQAAPAPWSPSRPEVPAARPPALAQPPSPAMPQRFDHPPVEAARPARSEPRQVERVPPREESPRPPGRPAMPPMPPPAMLPERGAAPPTHVDSPTQRERPGGGQRPPGAGRPDERRGDAQEGLRKPVHGQGVP